jgi:hypothetical protein
MTIFAQVPQHYCPLYTFSELVRARRLHLHTARSLPRGSERNQHLQIAASLNSLLNNSDWLDANTVGRHVDWRVHRGEHMRQVALNCSQDVSSASV